jgi:polysaccharide biosynthesis protein PslH
VRDAPAGRRLLFLLPFAPRLDAVHGGSLTIAQLLTALAQRHRIAVLYLRGPDEPQIDDSLRARCEVVEEVERRASGNLARRCIQRARVVAALVRGRPRWVAEWWTRSFQTRVRAVAEAWQPEIVQIEYHVMGQYLPALKTCAAPRVLVQHDPGAEGVRTGGRLAGQWKFHAGLELDRWTRYEKKIMAEVQAVVVFTERDKQVLTQLAPRARFVTIPIGTQVPERPLNPSGTIPPSLVFVGSFIHPPNTDAALRLIQSIFPRLRAHFPELLLYVVGTEPPASIRGMADGNVIVTGRVPDVSTFLDGASVVAVPLRLGGGMRVKVLEALAAGKALVASPLAIEGLELTDGDQVVLAETDQQFADAIGDLLRDPVKRADLARRARSWACANLGWQTSIAEYETLYDSLTE